MYLKIQRVAFTDFYECDQFLINHRNKVEQVPKTTGTQADLSVIRNSQVIATVALESGHEVYALNNDGKTIDSHWI